MFTEIGPREAREGVGGDGRTCHGLVAAIGTETGIRRETGTEAGTETGKGTGTGLGRGLGRETEVQTGIGRTIGSRTGSGIVTSTPTGIAMEQGTETGRETKMVQGAAGNEIVRGIELAHLQTERKLSCCKGEGKSRGGTLTLCIPVRGSQQDERRRTEWTGSALVC